MNEGILWLGILLVMLAIEIATLGLYTVWFAGGALAAFLCSLTGMPFLFQAVVFLIVSVALLTLIRPSAVRKFNKNREKTNIDSIIGEHAIVSQMISNLDETGKVKYRGMEWLAKSMNDARKIKVGTEVVICAIEGVTLIVEEKEEQEEERCQQ